MESQQKVLFDLDCMMRESGSWWVRHVPAFVRHFLKRIVREQDVNSLYQKCHNKEGFEFASLVLRNLDITLDVKGFENIPVNGQRYVFIANHPFGAVDGMSMLKLIGERFGNVNFIGNQLFDYIPNLKSVVTPVNVFGRNSRDAVRNLNRTYASDIQVLNFPAGEVSRNYQKNRIEDCEWQKSFLVKAIEYNRFIVPVFIEGVNSDRFYRWFTFRRRLHIPVNFELMLLPHEMLNKQGQTIHIVFGKPVNPEIFTSDLQTGQWVKQLRSYTYSLQTASIINEYRPKLQ
jgi:putative hemolysin